MGGDFNIGVRGLKIWGTIDLRLVYGLTRIYNGVAWFVGIGAYVAQYTIGNYGRDLNQELYDAIDGQ